MKHEQCASRPYSMGIGPIGDHNVIFARKFRFTLKGDNLPEHFVKSVKVDYHNKTIKFVYMDALDGKEGFHGLTWAYRLSRKILLGETLTLTTYDGCGNSLYEVKFFNLSLEGHTSEFDYKPSDESTQEIIVKFEEYGLHLLSCEPTGLDSKWSITIKDGEEEVVSDAVVLISDRPKINIVETEVNHLNSKILIPGKASWEPVDILFAGLHGDLVSAVRNEIGRRFEVIMTYKTDSFSETWTLQGAWFVDFDYNDLATRGKIRFQNVSYVPTNSLREENNDE